MENTHLDLLNKIYYSFLSNIKLLILNNKYIKEAGYELFEFEWNSFKKEIESISNDLISHPYLIIPFNLEDVVEDYPNLLKIQKNEIDIFKNYLMIFMSIFELRYLFVKFRSKILKKNESSATFRTSASLSRSATQADSPALPPSHGPHCSPPRADTLDSPKIGRAHV